jgi:integrase
MKTRLSATGIEKYKPLKDEDLLFDGNGLYLRYRKLAHGGLSRVWLYTYKVGSRSHYLTLGEHLAPLSAPQVQLYSLSENNSLTLATARAIASQITGWRKQGVDPKQFLHPEQSRADPDTGNDVATRPPTGGARNHTAQTDDTTRLTVRDLCRAWLADGVRRKDGNVALDRSLAADVLPAIGVIQVSDLSEHDLRAMLRKIVARGAERTAVVVPNTLRQMFTWAKKRQPWRGLLLNGDPLDLIEIDMIVSRGYDFHNQRDRVLTADEIRELRTIFQRVRDDYAAAPNRRSIQRPVERTTELAVWIMLSTLCRVGEMSMARWEHVDLDTSRWHLPKENVKGNLAAFTIFLSPFSVEQFRQLYELTCYSQWCFPARNKPGPLDVKAIAKQIGDRQSTFKRSKDGAPRVRMKNRAHGDLLVLGDGRSGAWTPHDLRRTGATIMQGLGVSLEVIERCQNHVLPGSKVRRHYLHHDYANEKREAWRLLGDRLSQIWQQP